MSDNIQKPCIW